MNNDLTLFNLLNFTPLNDNEKELFNFDVKIIDKFKSNLDKNTFYFGGQIKMSYNDIINLDTVQKVKDIDKQREIEYGGPCNSFEAQSIFYHKKDLEFLENMIKQYNLIIEQRVNQNSLK